MIIPYLHKGCGWDFLVSNSVGNGYISLLRFLYSLYYYPGLRPPVEGFTFFSSSLGIVKANFASALVLSSNLKKKGNFWGPHGCADKENIVCQLIIRSRNAHIFNYNKC